MRITDKALLTKAKDVALEEQKKTVELLELLVEIERRMLYVGLGYTSLFTYLVQELHYSEAESALRVKAMRLMIRAPEIKAKMEQGQIGLSVAASVEGYLREEKISAAKDVAEIISHCQGKSTREAQKILNEKKQRPSLEFTIKLRGAAAEKFERLKRLMPELSDSEIVDALVEEKLTEAKLKIKHHQAEQFESIDAAEAVVDNDVSLRKTKTLPIATSRTLHLRAQGQCEHIDLKTRKRCSSRSRLQAEHCYPQAWGGGHELSNLMILCQSHNLARATKSFGVDKIASLRLNSQKKTLSSDVIISKI